MFRKLNNVFRPNNQATRGRDAGSAGVSWSEQDYHSACTVRLVRSTSMLVVGERSQAAEGPILKRSKSTVSMESTLFYYQRQEDRIWLYSQSRNCLEYLEALVELRRKYTQTVGDFKRSEAEATASIKKKPPPPPPPGKDQGETIFSPFLKSGLAESKPVCLPLCEPQAPRTRDPGPPVPDEENTLRYLDAVIASCDSEAQRKPYTDDGHADVDFIVASTSAQHGLHSNWVLRVPRVTDDGEQKALPDSANQSSRKKCNKNGSTSSRLRLQRNPIHLPKVVESALQTLRFKPRLKKH